METEPSLENLDPSLLMWDIRRNMIPDPKPIKRSTIQFMYSDLPKQTKNWWLIVDPGNDKIDLCSVEPGFDVDLYVSTDLRTMTKIWMGFETLSNAYDANDILLTGNNDLEEKVRLWFSSNKGLSPFAGVKKLVN